MLELVVQNTNFLTYRLCASDSYYDLLFSGYGGGAFCAIGKPYMESIGLVNTFGYDQAIDRYRFVTINDMFYYPSWEFRSYIIHPETGVIESEERLAGFAALHAATSNTYNGGLGRMWASYSFTPDGYGIVEVRVPDCIPTDAMIANPLVTQTQIPILASTNFGFAICPERKLITVLNGLQQIAVYDYAASPALATLKYWQPFSELFGWSMGYEDDQRCWALFAGAVLGIATTKHTLVKYNYLYNRIELLTEMQTGTAPDRIAKVAWDTKRKKLAAVRIKADASNGAAVNSFDIYAPRPAMTQITVPVNIVPISDESKVTLISHLIGSKGEAGGSKEVSITCAPTADLVTRPTQPTADSGSVKIEINPTTAGASETITVSYNETKVT